MFSNFLVGSAILLAFAIVLIAGTPPLASLLRRHIQDEVIVAKYWGPLLGAWVILVSLAFGLFSLTEVAQPIAKLAPIVIVLGILAGLKIAVTKFKPNEDMG